VARFVAQVPMRWTDQDVYRHLNNARAVTLLEEARVVMVFDAAEAAGVTGFRDGLRVAMQIDELRAASFRIIYDMHDGPGEADAVAVSAWTRMAAYDLAAGHPRRLTAAEREYLGRWGAP